MNRKKEKERKRKDFPEQITKDNFPELVERAKKIKRRAFWLMIIVSSLYALLGLFLIIPLLFYVLGWLLLISSPDLSIEMFQNVLFGSFFVLLPFAMYVFLDWMTWFFERFLGLPNGKEKVFAGCVIVANYLRSNEKTKAIKEINDFVSYIGQFLADAGNVKRKAYSLEFNLLSKGKTQIQRMILFSKKNVSEMFLKFGLPFVKGEDEEAFSNLQELINEVRAYGEPRGRLYSLLGTIKDMRVFLLFATAVIELIVVALKILGRF